MISIRCALTIAYKTMRGRSRLRTLPYSASIGPASPTSRYPLGCHCVMHCGMCLLAHLVHVVDIAFFHEAYAVPPRLIEAESRVNRHEVSNFRINYTNCFEWSLTGTVPVSAPNVPRRCGADTANGKWHTPLGTARTEPSSHYPGFGRRLTTCVTSPLQINSFPIPIRCSTYSPPVYTDLYEFKYRPQDDIFTIHSSSPWDYT
jgi:hypothetical protein